MPGSSLCPALGLWEATGGLQVVTWPVCVGAFERWHGWWCLEMVEGGNSKTATIRVFLHYGQWEKKGKDGKISTLEVLGTD